MVFLCVFIWSLDDFAVFVFVGLCCLLLVVALFRWFLCAAGFLNCMVLPLVVGWIWFAGFPGIDLGC